MRSVILFTILFVLLSTLSSSVQAQSCDIFEAEMKSYFDKYSADTENYSRVMENYWAKCPKPTPAMNLIYFYSKAAYQLKTYQRSNYKRSAFEEARENFYLASKDFQILRIKRYSGDPFWEKLNQKYVELESTLSGTDPYRRYRSEKFRPKLESGESSTGFVKSDWRLNLSQGTSRAAENPNRKSFEKKYRYRDGYVDKIPTDKENPSSKDDEKDEYGIVGQVDKLTLMEYLDWLSKNKSKGPELVYYDATAWISKLGDGYEVVVNGMDSLVIRSLPGAMGKKLGSVKFGDALAKFANADPVYSSDVTFIKVQTETGQVGWVPQIATVPNGAIAAIIESVVASVSPGSRLDRGRFILSIGDLVVLSQERGDYIQIVTRNMGSVGWINANKGWSIIYDDVAIAMMYHEAMKLPYLVQRLRELQAITLYEGFYESPLSELVLKEIESLK